MCFDPTRRCCAADSFRRSVGSSSTSKRMYQRHACPANLRTQLLKTCTTLKSRAIPGTYLWGLFSLVTTTCDYTMSQKYCSDHSNIDTEMDPANVKSLAPTIGSAPSLLAMRIDSGDLQTSFWEPSKVDTDLSSQLIELEKPCGESTAILGE